MCWRHLRYFMCLSIKSTWLHVCSSLSIQGWASCRCCKKEKQTLKTSSISVWNRLIATMMDSSREAYKDIRVSMLYRSVTFHIHTHFICLYLSCKLGSCTRGGSATASYLFLERPSSGHTSQMSVWRLMYRQHRHSKMMGGVQGNLLSDLDQGIPELDWGETRGVG